MSSLKSNAAEKRRAFYDLVAKSRRIDTMFSLPDDKPLTKEEINEIDAYWGKYSFAYPEIDYRSFQTFKNRFGEFNVRHCPGAIRTKYFSKYLINREYQFALQNKAMLPILFSNIKQPVTVVRRMGGAFSDTDYRLLSFDEAIDRLFDVSRTKRLIMKLNMTGGGSGIKFIDNEKSKDDIVLQVRRAGISAFVVQELLEQSGFMEQFNSTSVNTIRISSLIWKSKVHVVAALIRIGKEGNEVDNFSQGGSILGVDIETGQCNNWCMNHDNERIRVLPNGFDLEESELIIPNFSEIKHKIVALHSRIPYIKYVSWDIALDSSNEPVLIENNFGGMIQIHEAVTGPVFSDFMDEMLDEFLLKNFFIEFKAGDFDCREYSDYVMIVGYNGSQDAIEIPDMLEGKPVRLKENLKTKKMIVKK